MKSNGGVLSADEVVHQPITTVLSGPAAGALGAALIAKVAGFDRVLTCDGGGTSTDVSVVIDGEPTLTTEGTVGAFPCKIPMIDVVTVGAGGGSIAWLSPEGTLKVGPQSAGADPGPLCYGKGGTEVTITDAHVVLGRIPPHLLGGEIPLDVEAARDGVDALAGEARALARRRAPTGVLEISAWNQANALRQVTVKRGLDVRDFTLTTFGGSGSLLLCRLMDILGIPTVLVPPEPGQRLGVRPAHRRREERLRADPRRARTTRSTPAPCARRTTSSTAQARERPAARGLRRGRARRSLRTADLRYFGQAFEVRVPVPDGELDRGRARRRRRGVPRRAPRRSTATTSPATRASRSSGSTCGSPASARSAAPRSAALPVAVRAPLEDALRRPTRAPAGLLRRRRGVRRDARPLARDLAPATSVAGPAVIEEYGSTVPLHPGFTATVDDFGNLLVHEERRDEPPQSRPPFPFGHLTADAGAERRPGAGRDRAGLAGQRRGRGRDRDRADQPQPDDPRRPRLPRRHPRPAAAQADRPVVLRARAPGRPRLPDRGDARGRRVLPQRRLPLRGRHRAPARPVRHRAGVRATGERGRVRPGVRPPRRHRRRRAGLDAERGDQRSSRRA